MTSSGQKSRVKERGGLFCLVGWSGVCFVQLWFPPCSLSQHLLMGAKWKEYFFKTNAVLLCVKVF